MTQKRTLEVDGHAVTGVAAGKYRPMNAGVIISRSHALGRIAWVCLWLGLGCGSGPMPPSQVPSSLERAGDQRDPQSAQSVEESLDLLARETMAYERARPVFERYCRACHTSTGVEANKSALHHFNMDRYPFGGHHQTEIARSVRTVLGTMGKVPTMPRNDPGAVQGEDLAVILEWADSFDLAAAAGLHSTGSDSHGHEH